jgi:hypothetical protein
MDRVINNMFKSKEELQNKYGMKEKSDWLNLKEGSNKIRIVSQFVDYGVHSIKDKGKYKSVICVGKDNHCSYCANNVPAKVQFLGWVIDRKDGKVKLLKIGWRIYEKLDNLQKSEEYGFTDLPEYDIDIIRKGEGLDTDYDVIPARKNSELTDKEKEMVLEMVRDPQEIIDRMKDKVLGSLPLEDSLDANEDDVSVNYDDIEINFGEYNK